MGRLEMWALNIHLLIGGLIALAAGLVLLVILWTGLKIGIWRIQQRRAQKAYVRETRRADGRRYPPFFGGVCEKCGQVSKKIYHPVVGPRLCADCYESHWREAEVEAKAEAAAGGTS